MRFSAFDVRFTRISDHFFTYFSPYISILFLMSKISQSSFLCLTVEFESVENNSFSFLFAGHNPRTGGSGYCVSAPESLGDCILWAAVSRLIKPTSKFFKFYKIHVIF